MKWFRKHVKLGSRLALLALVVQFALSFGHFHPFAAQAAPAIQTSLTDAVAAYSGPDATEEAAIDTVGRQLPSNHDRQHPADACAICAVVSLAGNALFAAPPVLSLPLAVELLYRATDAGFLHLDTAHPAFQSRAPPLS